MNVILGLWVCLGGGREVWELVINFRIRGWFFGFTSFLLAPCVCSSNIISDFVQFSFLAFSHIYLSPNFSKCVLFSYIYFFQFCFNFLPVQPEALFIIFFFFFILIFFFFPNFLHFPFYVFIFSAVLYSQCLSKLSVVS